MYHERVRRSSGNETDVERDIDRNKISLRSTSRERGPGIKRRKEEQEQLRFKKAVRTSMSRMSDAVEESNDVMRKIGMEVSKSVQNEMMMTAMGFLDKNSPTFKTLLERVCENAMSNTQIFNNNNAPTENNNSGERTRSALRYINDDGQGAESGSRPSGINDDGNSGEQDESEDEEDDEEEEETGAHAGVALD